MMGELYRAIVPVAPLRSTDKDASEMVSQLLYGETCHVLERRSSWARIKCAFDGYVGWIDEKQIDKIVLSENMQEALVSSILLYGTSALGNVNTVLSTGSEVLVDTISHKFLHNGTLFTIAFGTVLLKPETLHIRDMIKLAHNFVNVPYLWGGRNAMGIDCSGLTQVLFKLAGISLPRDASQQVKIGQEVTNLGDTLSGDVAFFGKDMANITHVGILLDCNTIIHASGKVRIDDFNEKGIFNTELNTITHQLQVVNRIK